jgi:hypothetical protein
MGRRDLLLVRQVFSELEQKGTKIAKECIRVFRHPKVRSALPMLFGALRCLRVLLLKKRNHLSHLAVQGSEHLRIPDASWSHAPRCLAAHRPEGQLQRTQRTAENASAAHPSALLCGDTSAPCGGRFMESSHLLSHASRGQEPEQWAMGNEQWRQFPILPIFNCRLPIWASWSLRRRLTPRRRRPG